MPAKDDTESANSATITAGETLTLDDEPSLNPHNWPQARKFLVLAIGLCLVANSTNGTSLASGGVESTIKEFGLRDGYGWEVLPVSIFLVGYFIGNTTLAPLSENYGRRPVNLVTMFGFAIWMMACALAPNWPAFIVFRLINGFFAAGAPSTISGICADLYEEDTRRGRALLGYNMATNFGSVLGPIISGWAVLDTWRLSFWIGLGYSGVCFLAVWFGMPETNANIILDKRAKQIRNTTGSSTPHGPRDDEVFVWHDFVTKVLIRPLVMLYREPLVFFTCIYLAFQYAVFYVFFQSYPLIFEDIYGFTHGEEGLTFLGFGIGVFLALPVEYIWEMIYSRASSQNQSWTKHHGAKRLPPACASGPLIVISLFWSAWTSRSSIHWISPALSGIPYGLGYTVNFNALLNYLVDNYASYASSASAASSIIRQIMGAGLPFAAVPMYTALGIDWASSLLGFVAAGMSLIPFAFWMYGERLLKRSKWAQELAREKGVD